MFGKKLAGGTAVMAAVLIVGCGQEPAATSTTATKAVAKKDADAKAGHDHSGWWCDEHGVPEDECSQCSAKVAKAFKAKGDWCDKHDRAKSQCFVCDPSLKEQYAAKYRAKYGKEPPPVEEEKDGKGEKK